jgi:dUTP pyrophosphatase
MKIKVKVLTEGCMPIINEKGDAFDLRAAADVILNAPQAGVLHQENNKKLRDVKFNNFTIIPLGIAMELPKNFVADLRPRSSMFKKWYICQTNTPGLIDSSYCGDEDEWGLPVIAMSKSHICKGDRLCQFEIRPSQKATWWQWLKWIFKRKIEFVQVDTLGNKSRGGFGEGTKNVK